MMPSKDSLLLYEEKGRARRRLILQLFSNDDSKKVINWITETKSSFGEDGLSNE
jgi:hypothetical protein